MYGLFQTTFYFGYMALFSVGLGIMCGEYHLVISKTDLLWLRESSFNMTRGRGGGGVKILKLEA